ncbi:MAG: hypothetical protein GX852_06075 [Clostridiales bacterium]|nr:hypothetical protein [Clostridiales bacterium]
MKKYYSYIAVFLYALATILYIASILSGENRTILICFGSAAMCFGAVLTIEANKDNKK